MNPFVNFLRHYASQPVPPHLEKLFSISGKKESEKYIHDLEISKVDLVTLSHTCAKIGYQHFIENGQWIPDHLETTREESDLWW